MLKIIRTCCDIVTGSFGKQRKDVISRFVRDVVCVALSFKPSILIDYCHLSLTQVHDALKALVDYSDDYMGEFLRQVRCVCFDNTILLVNSSALVKCLDTNLPAFIDLTCNAPVVCTYTQHVNVAVQTKRLLDTNQSEWDGSSYPNVAGPTLCGMLLGYPVVYVCNVDSDLTSESQCLSNRDLCVIKCSVGFTGKASETTKWHELYSFSVPLSLRADVTGAIELWKHRMSQHEARFANRNRVTLTIAENVVNLPSVSL
jgi:hypothetical protein